MEKREVRTLLQFPHKFSSDEEADQIVREFINDRLRNLVILNIEMGAGKPYQEVSVHDPQFQDYVYYFFPHCFSDEDAAKGFLLLLQYLSAEKEIKLNMALRFALHMVIEDAIELAKDTNTSTVERIPDIYRAYVLSRMREDDILKWPEAVASGEAADVRIRRTEDLLSYDKLVFQDMSFLQLDDMSLAQYTKSGYGR